MHWLIFCSVSSRQCYVAGTSVSEVCLEANAVDLGK